MFLAYIVIFFVLIVAYSWLIEPMAFNIQKIKAHVPGNNARVLFISDFHMGRGRFWFRYTLLLRKIMAVQNENALDAILLGGDYLDFDIRYLPQLEKFVEELSRLNVKMYAVLGDHDHKKIDPELIRNALRKHNVVVLEDELVDLGSWRLFGAKELRFDVEYDVKKNGRNVPDGTREKIRNRVREMNPEIGGTPLIVISHNPDAVYFRQIPAESLVIAGHTHGGQIWPLTWFGYRSWKFVPGGTFGSWSGRCEIEKKQLIISNGVGCSAWPLRLGRRPDVLVVQISG